MDEEPQARPPVRAFFFDELVVRWPTSEAARQDIFAHANDIGVQERHPGSRELLDAADSVEAARQGGRTRRRAGAGVRPRCSSALSARSSGSGQADPDAGIDPGEPPARPAAEGGAFEHDDDYGAIGHTPDRLGPMGAPDRVEGEAGVDRAAADERQVDGYGRGGSAAPAGIDREMGGGRRIPYVAGAAQGSSSFRGRSAADP
jgi:hypothetical protein